MEWGRTGQGKGRVAEKLEKQNSFVAHHTLHQPELFCHPQIEWEYFFSDLSGIKNSHHSLPMPELYCLGFKKNVGTTDDSAKMFLSSTLDLLMNSWTLNNY